VFYLFYSIIQLWHVDHIPLYFIGAN